MKPYPWFNTEALIRGKPYECNFAMPIALNVHSVQDVQFACYTYVYIIIMFTSLLKLKTKEKLKAGSEVDLCCLM